MASSPKYYDSLGFVANLHRRWPDTRLRDIAADLVTCEAASRADGTFLSYLDAKVEARRAFFADTLRAIYSVVKGAIGPADIPTPELDAFNARRK